MSLSPALHRRSRPGGLRAEAIFIGRSLRHAMRDVESLLMAIALPVILMLMFTFVFGGALDPSGDYVDYVVPGIILTCAGFGASSTALSVAGDMTTGFIDRLRTMPVRAGAVITGHVVASLAKNLFATGIVFAVAVLIGFRPTATWAEWCGVIALIALYILAITYLFAAIGLAAKSAESASGYGFILLFLPYVSSAFVPVDTMPDWLTWFADNQPVTPIIDALRSALIGTPMGDSALLGVGWCVLILAVALLWANRMFAARADRR
ncbi:ABC-2 type transport system permease protein [Brevibacterium sanguinis]|uniref:Transport permease protein n=2 Tax=Brevibacterium TaxID=1696 RepID=A0A366IHU5_9MICO|nr:MULTISPECIES: ABC transporter permease [Brevibacterium]RBP63401.1 ABC-2 type transport system permease protein [Brevibacterium sanguinis]RBP69868.1 ABC-2 type transport system permease protein [Brevibacterium celere]